MKSISDQIFEQSIRERVEVKNLDSVIRNPGRCLKGDARTCMEIEKVVAGERCPKEGCAERRTKSL